MSRRSTSSSAATAEPPYSDGSTPPVGTVDLGSLRRLRPISNVFGFDRGGCIDRYYIERFLADHAADIRGRVLEVADREYTQRFGGDRVTQSDVLYLEAGRRKATLIADLTKADGFEPDAFDGVILTQTLQHIYDAQAAVKTLHHTLKPGGVVLATLPGISQISRYDMDRWGDYWRFTTQSARRLFEGAFEREAVNVQAHGNVLTAVAFLHGLAAEELHQDELNHHDPDYEMLITVRACKAGTSGKQDCAS